MLFGAAVPRGSQGARIAMARAAAQYGPPKEVVSSECGALAYWLGALPCVAAGDGFIAEGWMRWCQPAKEAGVPGWLEALRSARGDFVCLTLVEDGVLVAAGPAGGYRPVYCANEDGAWFVSTSLRALATILRTPPAVNRDGLAARLTALPLSTPTETTFLGIERLAIGEAWELRPGTPLRRISLPRRNDVPEVRERDASEQLWEALEGAVSRSMEGARHVGVLVSGGLDSSAVMAAACRQAEKRGDGSTVRAFALDFDTSDPDDDRPYRHALLRKLRIEPTSITPEEAASEVRASLVLDAQPLFPTTGTLVLTAARRARAEGTSVLMTGLGGDNVFEGNPVIFGDLVRRGQVRMGLSGIARLRGPPSRGALWRLRQYVLKPLLAPFIPGHLRRRRRRRLLESEFPWEGPALRRWFRERTAVDGAPDPGLDSSPLDRYRALCDMPFTADLAITRSMLEGASGCPQRDPLFDDDLIATVAGIHPLALFRGEWRRGLLRYAMAGRVPDEVRFRTGKAYLDPAVARMVSLAGGLRAFADLADVRMLADLGLAEPRAFRKNFDRLARNPDAFIWWSIWPALAGEAFLRQHAAGTWS